MGTAVSNSIWSTCGSHRQCAASRHPPLGTQQAALTPLIFAETSSFQRDYIMCSQAKWLCCGPLCHCSNQKAPTVCIGSVDSGRLVEGTAAALEHSAPLKGGCSHTLPGSHWCRSKGTSKLGMGYRQLLQASIACLWAGMSTLCGSWASTFPHPPP